MPPPVPEQLSRTIETIYRLESDRVLATLVRLLGDLDLAEEAMHEAFAAALESWPQTGIPDKPRPWLISTARFKAIDGMRRRARFDGAQRDLAAYIEARINEAPLDARFAKTRSGPRNARFSGRRKDVWVSYKCDCAALTTLSAAGKY
jgi:RNA polymerase sigma-70 factor (ECF subfamily)